MSCLWQDKHLLSVSLSGFINYLNVDDPTTPIRVVKVNLTLKATSEIHYLQPYNLCFVNVLPHQGHNKPITVLTLSPDKNTIYTGSHDGYVTNWRTSSGENDRVKGQGHGNQINGMKAAKNLLYTAGIDDTLRTIDIDDNSYIDTSTVKLDSQPRGLDIYQDLVVTASVRQV